MARPVRNPAGLEPAPTVPQKFQNPVLYAFANAVWNCPTAADVAITLNEATATV
jgi:hypothetical protein